MVNPATWSSGLETSSACRQGANIATVRAAMMNTAWQETHATERNKNNNATFDELA